PPSEPSKSSSVGDIVPLISAEAAEAPSPKPSWQEAPPPVRQKAGTALPPSRPTVSAPPEPKTEPKPTAEAPAWAKAPPPMRQPAKSNDTSASAPSESPPAVKTPAAVHSAAPATEEKRDDGPRV